ncbi:phage tail tape measure protein [Coprococcus catus]|uniref:phage tail tape measure protein n=1 Tax=Coprococcus catus TaxID=116085 RepID=UPI003D0071D1
MSDFTINIDSKLDLSKARSEMNSFLSKFKNEPIKINVELDPKSINTSNFGKQMQSSFSSAGTNAGKAYSTALQNQINAMAKTQRNAFSEPLKNMSKYEKSYSDMWNKLLSKAPSTYGKNQQQIAFDKYFAQVEQMAQKASEVQKRVSQKFLDVESSSVKKTLTKYSGTNSSEYKALESSYNKLISLQKELKTGISDDGFGRTLSDKAMVSKYQQFYEVLTKCKNEMKLLSNESSSFAKPFNQLDATTASNKTLTWLKNNSKAAKDYGDRLKELAELQRTATNADDLKNYTKQVNDIKTLAASQGKTGASFGAEFKRATLQIGQFAGIYGGWQLVTDSIRKSVSELKEMDSTLTEISKVSDMTQSQLKQLGENSFDYASKYGKKVNDYLQGVTEMNRSGFYGQQGIDLANVSVLAQAAGDMTADVANSYLLATNAAYDYAGSAEKLNAVLDGQNMITNKNSVNMTDMAEATSIAASMASQTGIKVNELSAIIGTAVSRTKQGGNEIGTALKSLFVNLQDTSNKKIVGTFEELGISQTKFINGSEQLKTPIELLRELADAYNSLPEGSELKADVLRNIGNKRQANVLSAILGGISNGEYDKMLQNYSQGMGSAAKEAEKSANNWEGSLNKLSNSWTKFVGNFADTSLITGGVNAINFLINALNNLVTTLTPLGTIGAGVGIFELFKNLDLFYFKLVTSYERMQRKWCCKQLCVVTF